MKFRSKNYGQTLPVQMFATTTPAPTTANSIDEYVGKCIRFTQSFRAWAGDNANLIFGEFGVPSDRTGQEQINWTNAFDAVLAACVSNNIGCFPWASGNSWNNYVLATHSINNGVWSDTPLTPILKKYGKDW